MIKRIVYMLILFCLPHLSSAADEGQINQEKQYVLLLNSYHKGYKWTDDITGSIEDIFKRNKMDAVLFIEYMDTKKISSPEYFQKLPQIIKLKYSKYKFDCIIASDNDSLEFLIKYRDTIFPEVPVVFCGINYFRDEWIKGLTGFTGVVEIADYRESINIALKLHPGTKNIIVINDDTITGKMVRAELDKIVPLYKNRLNFIFYDNMTIWEIISKVSALSRDSLVLLTFYFKDAAGNLFEYMESTTIITRHSAVPVYSTWDFNLGFGIVGGKLTSGSQQGKAAAVLAMRILLGEDPDSLSIVSESPNRYMFDYNQLEKFRISLSRLPDESIIINTPDTLYGRYKTLIWSVSVIIVFLVTVIGVLIVNIHERKKAEKLLVDSWDRLQLVIESTRDTLWDYNPESGIIIRDSAWQVVTGIKAEGPDLTYNEWRNYIHPDDLNIVERAFLDHIKGISSYFEVKYRMISDQGAWKWILTRGKVVEKDLKGKVTRVTGTSRDITDLQKKEHQFNQMQKIETVNTLASGLAHDFNNILTGIAGTLYLIRNGVEKINGFEGDVMKEYITSSLDIIDRAAGMTRQLLSSARIDDIKVAPVDINQLLKRVYEIIRNSFDKSIDINLNFSEEPALILADESQIEQVILNVCINAAHAMTIMREDASQYGGDLTITLRNYTADPPFLARHPEAMDWRLLLLEVSDTGVGIPAEVANKIFDPFFTTKEKNLGTGLGLAMVADIVKQYNGFIDIYSEPGKGTSINIFFPRLFDAPLPESDKKTAYSRVPDNDGGLILVVDDEIIIRESCQKYLELNGYSVISASNSDDALELFREHLSIQAVYVDLIMPGTSGLDTIAEIRKINPGIKIILSTGLRNDPRLKKIENDLNISFLFKPFSMEELLLNLES